MEINMASLKEKIARKIEQSPHLTLVDLCLDFPHIGTYSFVDALMDVIEQIKPQLKSQFFLSQAEAVMTQIPAQENLNERVTLLCRQLAVIQTSNMSSRYIQATDGHRHFAGKADTVMFGDSITEWGLWGEMFPSLSIINRGIAGDTTLGMLSRIDTTLQLKPNKLFVMAGINDIAQGHHVDDIFKRYVEMLSTWKANDIEPIVQSTLYVGQRLSDWNPLVAELNRLLAQYCHESGITFVDLTEKLCPNALLPIEYSCDELHLRAAAYQQWRETIAHLLK
ncbi:lysophospholipase [Vibrio sp. 99-8-1]|nr:lysophospholipase [Vibrio sp. 99-8-1]